MWIKFNTTEEDDLLGLYAQECEIWTRGQTILIFKFKLNENEMVISIENLFLDQYLLS